MAAGPLSRLRAASEVLESVDEECLPWTYVTSSDGPGGEERATGEAPAYTRQGVWNKAKKRGSGLTRKRWKTLDGDATKSTSGAESADWTAEEEYSLCQAVAMSLQGGAPRPAGLSSARLAKELQTVTVSRPLATCLVPAHDYAEVVAHVRSGGFRRAFLCFRQGRNWRDRDSLAPGSPTRRSPDDPASEIEESSSDTSREVCIRGQAKPKTPEHLGRSCDPDDTTKSSKAHRSILSPDLDSIHNFQGSVEEVLREGKGSAVDKGDDVHPRRKGLSKLRSKQIQHVSTDKTISEAAVQQVSAESKVPQPKMDIHSSDGRAKGRQESDGTRKEPSRSRSKHNQQGLTNKDTSAFACFAEPKDVQQPESDVFTSDDQSCHSGAPGGVGEVGRRIKKQTIRRGRRNALPASTSSELGEVSCISQAGEDRSDRGRTNSESGLPGQGGRERREHVAVRRKRKIGQDSETGSVGSAEEEGRTGPVPTANVQPLGNLQGNKNVEGKKSFRNFRKKFLDRCLEMQSSALSGKLPLQKQSENAKMQVDEYLTVQQLQQNRKSILDACLLAQQNS